MGKTIAIVGASADRRKYGNKAVRAFRDGGWTVYPVNPRAEEIEGLRSYKSLDEVPHPLDRVALYVPPKAAKSLLPAIAASGASEVFFNPGTCDDEVLEEARKQGINPIQACSIVNIGLRPEQYPDE